MTIHCSPILPYDCPTLELPKRTPEPAILRQPLCTLTSGKAFTMAAYVVQRLDRTEETVKEAAEFQERSSYKD